MAFEHDLGLKMVRKHKDGVTCALVVRPDHMNSNGVMHGGVVASIADEAAWYTIIAALGTEKPMTTSELKVNYLRPIAGKRATARGYLLKLGRMLSVTRVDIFDDKKKLAAHATVTYAMLG